MATHATRLTLSDVLLTSRPFWWIATAAPFAVGFFVTRGFELSWPLYVGVVYFALGYNLLLYGADDVFSRRSDTVLAKSKHKALWAVILTLNVPFWLYFAAMGRSESLIWFMLMLFLALAYSARGLRYKEVPGLDSFTSAFHYTSPFIFGVLFAGGDNFWLPAFLSFFIWAMASHAFGAIQRVKTDREAGVSTIAVKLGPETTLLFCLSLYLVAALLPVVYYGWKGLFPSAVLLWYVVLALTTAPFRKHDDHGIFKRAWQTLTWMNYVCGGILAMYLLLMHHLA